MKVIKSISVYLVLCIAITGLNGCFYEGGNSNRMEGSGPIVKRTLDLENFEGIVIQNSANVFLRQGESQEVEIEGQENIVRNLDTEVSGGVWRIRNKRRVWRMQKININITIPEINYIKIAGSGSVKTLNNFENLNDIELRIGGSGNINIDIEAKDVQGRIGGSGSIILSGTARRIDFGVQGSGDISAENLKARFGKARIGGSGSISTHVTENLDARIGGSGNISYRGKPKVNSSVSGSGSIRHR